VFADFVASFEDSRVAGKTFVRGNTINPETKGKLCYILLQCLMVNMLYLRKGLKGSILGKLLEI